MTNHQLLNNNIVTLSGEVVSEPVYSHQVFNEGFFTLNMSVPRLSGQVDIIPITISERLLGEADVKVGSNISVKGQFRSYNKIENDKSRLVLTVFVRELCEYSPTDNPNVVEISGYICKTPIFRTTPFNREIADVLVAVNRSYNKSDYIPSIAWGRNARFVSNLKVGTKINAVGRVQSREYTKVLDDETSPIVKTAYELSISKIDIENT